MTIAEQIADRMWGRQIANRFENRSNSWADVTPGSEASWRWGRDATLHRFRDGSWILIQSSSWDVLYDNGYELVDADGEYWFTLVEGEPTRPGMTA